MPQDQELNKILKEMWRIEEKMNANSVGKEEEATLEETLFWHCNLNVIQEYYAKMNAYWAPKRAI